jgi:RES domain-containing protein
VTLWRISNHVHLAGEGGLRASGRWHTRGRRIVYCTTTPAAALLETLVHLEIEFEDLPRRYRLLKLDAPDTLAIERVAPAELPKDWIERPDVTRAIGDAWLAASRTPLLKVPSALAPETDNVLVNPNHRDAARIRIGQVSEHPIDPRLMK